MGLPGVSLINTTGPTWRVLPSRGSSTSLIWRLCNTWEWFMPSWAVIYGSAATLVVSLTKMSIHSSRVLFCTLSRTIFSSMGPVLIADGGGSLEPWVFIDVPHVQIAHHGAKEAFHDVGKLNPLTVPGTCGQVAVGVGAATPDVLVSRVLVGLTLRHLALYPAHVVEGGVTVWEEAGLHLLAPVRSCPSRRVRRLCP